MLSNFWDRVAADLGRPGQGRTVAAEAVGSPLFERAPIGLRGVDFRNPPKPALAWGVEEPDLAEDGAHLRMPGTVRPNPSESMLGFFGTPLAERRFNSEV